MPNNFCHRSNWFVADKLSLFSSYTKYEDRKLAFHVLLTITFLIKEVFQHAAWKTFVHILFKRIYKTGAKSFPVFETRIH